MAKSNGNPDAVGLGSSESQKGFIEEVIVELGLEGGGGTEVLDVGQGVFMASIILLSIFEK